MRLGSTHLLLLATALASGRAGSARAVDSPTAPKPPATVSGRVVAEGRGVAGVLVSAIPVELPLALAQREARREPPPAALATVRTDASGRFALPVPKSAAGSPARFELTLDGSIVPVRLRRTLEGARDVGDILVERATPLEGRVVDDAGSPFVGATLRLTPPSARSTRTPPRGSTKRPPPGRTGASASRPRPPGATSSWPRLPALVPQAERMPDRRTQPVRCGSPPANPCGDESFCPTARHLRRRRWSASRLSAPHVGWR